MLFNWRQVPFIRLITPFILGIITALQFDFYFPHYFLGSTFFILLLFWFFNQHQNYQSRWQRGVLINVLLFLISYQLTISNNPRNSADYFGHHLTENSILLGQIIDIPIHKNSTKLLLKIQKRGDSIQNSIQMNSTDGLLLCYLQRDSSTEMLKYGDKIVLNALPRTIKAPTNPEQFDYKNYLKYKKIEYQVYATTSKWQFYEASDSWSLLRFGAECRSYCLNLLKKALPTTNEFSVGSALILGYKAEISEEVRSAYSETGAMHILAVSGLHVGLIAWFLGLFFSRVRWHSRHWANIKTILILLLMWSFAILTGLSASVLRATTMFSVVVIGQNSRLNANIYNTLAVSAFILLVYNPYFILDVGFQLSYVAVVGIVFFQPKIASLWQVQNKIGRYFWELVAVSIAAQISTIPLTLYYFHQFPVWFWLSGLVAIPAAAFILGLGLLYLIFSSLPYIGSGLGVVLHYLIAVVNWFIFQIKAFPLGLITGVWLEQWAVVALFLGIISLGIMLLRDRLVWLIPFLVSVLLIFGYGSYLTITNATQQQVIIYDINKQSAIDLIDGRALVSIQDTGLSIQNYEFAARNHHWKLGVEDSYQLGFQDSLTNNSIQIRPNWIQFDSLLFAIIDEPINGIFPHPIAVDYVVIRNNPKLYIHQLFQNYKPKKIIFDTSNPTWRIAYWQKDCEELGLSYHNIAKEGAFILNLKD